MEVLYIEDNLADVKLLEHRLKRSGLSHLRLQHATTIKQASEMIKQQGIELILLDLSLPDARGLEGLTYLKNQVDLPIVVLTGNIDRTVGVEAIRNGAQDYLVKGEYSEEMLDKVCSYAVERFSIHKALKNTLVQLEEEKRKVEVKSRQINAMTSLLVNDLKNPVNAITNLANLLLDTKLTEEQERYIQQIDRSSSSMLDHLLSMIETTEFNKGKVNVDLVEDNPIYTVNAVIDGFLLDAFQQNVIIDVKYGKEQPLALFDKKVLQQLLNALVKFFLNHVQHAGRLQFDAEETEGLFKIIVQSKGIFIENDELLDFLGEYLSDEQMQEADQKMVEGYQFQRAREQLRSIGGSLQAKAVKPGLFAFEIYLPLSV
ncbi:ATP-binding response regulator [Algivirga pacifica]